MPAHFSLTHLLYHLNRLIASVFLKLFLFLLFSKNLYRLNFSGIYLSFLILYAQHFFVFFQKSSFAAPPNGFAAERFPPGFRQYCNFVSLIRYCTERRCMLKRRYRAAHAVNQKEPHPCGSGSSFCAPPSCGVRSVFMFIFCFYNTCAGSTLRSQQLRLLTMQVRTR